MKQATNLFRVGTNGRGLYEFTDDVVAWIGEQKIQTGLLTLFCRHTSASLTIQENASPEVRSDMEAAFERLAPEAPELYQHAEEGPDDMPAHIRAALTGVTLPIPVIGGRLALGMWQGIFLFEHRRRAHRREVAAHLLGA